MERFDVVVVGARCAGSSIAAFLARRGVRVCVVDLATFPSDTPSTHVLQPSGVIQLKKLGVFDSVLAADAPPLTRFTIQVGMARIDVTIDPDEYGGPGVCVRRIVLDPLLVDAARDAGVDVRTGVRVTGLLRDDSGRVVGVETSDGAIGADLVIGADGRRSTVATLAGAREYAHAPAGRLFMWGYFSDVPNRDGHITLARFDDLAFLSSPTDSGLHLALIAPSLSRKHEFMADRERSLRDGIRAWPELNELVGGAELAGPVHAVASWHGFFREAAGPGWVLLGDAGQFKDPTPGQGISDSLRHSARLADAVVGGLRGGPLAMDAQLHRWWKWRDRDSREMHWFATDLGAPGHLPIVREAVFADVAADPDASVSFVRVMNHDGKPSKVFSARRMVRAASQLVREQPHRRGEVLREVGGLIADNVRHARLDRPKPTPASRGRRLGVRRGSRAAKAAASALRS